MTALWANYTFQNCLTLFLIGVGCVLFIQAGKREYWRLAWLQLCQSRLAMGAAGILVIYLTLGLMDCIAWRDKSLDQTGKPIIGQNGQPQLEHEGRTIIDRLFSPIIGSAESSYSAPLATEEFVMRKIEQPDGSKARGYRSLKHAGSHLKSAQSASRDIITRLIFIFFGAIAYGCFARLLAGFHGCLSTAIALYLSFLSVILFNVFCSVNLWVNSAASIVLPPIFGIVLSRKIKPKSQRDEIKKNAVTLNLLGVFIGGLAFLTGLVIFIGARYHLLGTDEVGRDVLYLAVKGIRIGIIIGGVPTFFVIPIAILFGIVAGYYDHSYQNQIRTG